LVNLNHLRQERFSHRRAVGGFLSLQVPLGCDQQSEEAVGWGLIECQPK